MWEWVWLSLIPSSGMTLPKLHCKNSLSLSAFCFSGIKTLISFFFFFSFLFQGVHRPPKRHIIRLKCVLNTWSSPVLHQTQCSLLGPSVLSVNLVSHDLIRNWKLMACGPYAAVVSFIWPIEYFPEI